MLIGSKWLWRGALALALGAVLLLLLAVQGTPQVPPRADVTPADVDRAMNMLRAYDPRRAPPGRLHRLPLRERDVDLLVDHAARRWLDANTRVQLLPGLLLLQASFAAPLGRWLNVDVVLRQTAALPEIDRLRIGRLPLPPVLALPLLRVLAARHGLQTDALLDADWIERVTLHRGQMSLSYRLRPDTAQRLRSAFVAPAEQRRLRAYAERLAGVARRVEGDTAALHQLLTPLLALAAERTAAGGDAVEENRAALLTLSFFATHRPLGLLVPTAYDWPRARPLLLTLQQREDFALHFLLSAVIAAQAGTPLADAVGLWKEIADARSGGSGFSFNDLAADRAGTRFGELAVREPARLQSRIAAAADERELMPDASDLPEFLSQADFTARYGGVGGAGYNRLVAEIEARVAALPMYR
jgi:hypothetical protein